jgi:hypothetical protein
VDSVTQIDVPPVAAEGPEMNLPSKKDRDEVGTVRNSL